MLVLVRVALVALPAHKRHADHAEGVGRLAVALDDVRAPRVRDRRLGVGIHVHLDEPVVPDRRLPAYQEDMGEGSALHLWVTATAGSRARTIRPAQSQRVMSPLPR